MTTPVSDPTISRVTPNIPRNAASEKVAWMLIALGAIVRIRIYLACRSLWIDEARIALNLVHRPLVQLLTRPLEFEQAAPAGFLTVEKGITAALGFSEYALRLFPLMAGIGTLVLVYLVARRLTAAGPMLLAISMTAFSKGFIDYSVMMKQYSSDAFMTLLVIWSALPLFGATEWRRSWVVRFAVVALLAILFSHAAVFTVVGVSIVVLVGELSSRRWNNAALLCLANVPAALAIAGEYFLSLRSIEQSDYLHNYWKGAFLPLPIHPGTSIHWFMRAFYQPIETMGGYRTWKIDRVALVAGVVCLLIRRPRVFWFLIAPILLAVLAAGAQAYPFKERLALFAVPALFLITSTGLCSATCLLPVNIGKYLAALLAGIMLYPGFAFWAKSLRSPEPFEEIKPALAYVREHHRTGDEILVYCSTVPAFLFYQSAEGLEATHPVLCPSIEPASQRADVARLPVSSRVWVLLTHTDPDGTGSRAKPLIDALSFRGEKIDEFNAPGGTATACLYRLDR